MDHPKTLSTNLKSEEMICPGETYAIYRSVHYARLAAYYPACRKCSLRYETGHLSKQVLEQIEEVTKREEREDFFSEQGLRGIYLNEINRSYANRAASSFGTLIWDQRPRKGKTDLAGQSRFKISTPKIVVGRDPRPSSPDIYSGVITGLTQMGCEIIDISITTSPCFRFAVNHLEASGGIFITGEGSPPSWTGMDFVVNESGTISESFSLTKLKERMAYPSNRPTREAGHQRHFQANVPYEASLWKHFHALRPLKILIACPNLMIQKNLKKLFETLPCQLTLINLPCRERTLSDPQDPDIETLSHLVLSKHYDLGMVIDDDGMKSCFVDDLGNFIDQDLTTCLIADLLLAESPDSQIVLEENSFQSMKLLIDRLKKQPVNGGCSVPKIAKAMSESEAVFGRGAEGQFWFREIFPHCDAILTLARMLDILSRDDTPFSQLSVQIKESLSV